MAVIYIYVPGGDPLRFWGKPIDEALCAAGIPFGWTSDYDGIEVNDRKRALDVILDYLRGGDAPPDTMVWVADEEVTFRVGDLPGGSDHGDG